MRTGELSLVFQPRIVERARLSWDALRLVILTSANAGDVFLGLFIRSICQVRRTHRVDRIHELRTGKIVCATECIVSSQLRAVSGRALAKPLPDGHRRSGARLGLAGRPPTQVSLAG